MTAFKFLTAAGTLKIGALGLAAYVTLTVAGPLWIPCTM